MNILAMCLGMVAKDFFGTLLVISESKGRALLAGLLDASMDVSQLVSIGAGTLALHDASSLPVKVAICSALWVTAFGTTGLTTFYGRRMKVDS